MNNGTGTPEDDTIDRYKDITQEYDKSLNRQLSVIDRLQDKSLEVMKLNFLVIAALVAGSSTFFDEEYAIFIAATALCFVYSIFSLINVYSSSRRQQFKHGWGHDDIDTLLSKSSKLEYYQSIAYSYNYWVGVNRFRYAEPLRFYQRGLWAALTGIFCFSAIIIKIISPPYPAIIVLPPYPIIVDASILAICFIAGMKGYEFTAMVQKFPDQEPEYHEQ